MELTFIDSIKNGFGRLMEAVYPDLAQKFNFRILYEALFPFLALAAGIAALWLLTRPFSKFRRYFFVVGTVAVIIFLAVGVLAPEYMETADKWVEDQVTQLEGQLTGGAQGSAPQSGAEESLSSYGYVKSSTGERAILRSSATAKANNQLKTLEDYALALVKGSSANQEGTWYHINLAGTEGYIHSDSFHVLGLDELSAFLESEEYRKAANTASGPSTPDPIATSHAQVIVANPATSTPRASADAASLRGVNLLSGGLQERASSNGFLEYKVREVLSPYVGQTVTVSFDIMPDTDERIRVYPYQNSGVSIADTGWFDLKAGTYTRVSMTTTVKDHGQKTGYTTGGIGIYNDSRNSFTVRRMKIELGGQATAFSLAPQDPLRGRNLLPGYAEEHTTINGRLLVPVQSALESYVGLTVNVSFDLKCSDSREISASAYQNRGVSIGSDAESQAVFTTSPGQYVRFSFSTVVTEYNQGSGMLQLLDTSLIKKSFSIQRLKIELGEETTGWSPAPEDAG